MRALVVLAEVHQLNPDQLTKTETIAQAQGIPGKFLEVILGQLTRGGIVASQRGATGGYRLNRPASDISLADVIAALDNARAHDAPLPMQVTSSGTGTGADMVWEVLRMQMHRFLERTTLADVASGQPGREFGSS